MFIAQSPIGKTEGLLRTRRPGDGIQPNNLCWMEASEFILLSLIFSTEMDVNLKKSLG